MSPLESAGGQAPRGVRASVGVSVLTGLVSAVPLGRTPRWVSRSVAPVSGVTLWATSFAAVRGAAEPDQPVSPRQVLVPVAAGLVAGGATLGVMAASVAMDRRMEAALVKRGVTRPRLALAASSGLLAFAMDRLDRGRRAPQHDRA